MTRDTDAQALDRLIEQEDVLQICYWYQGEGFGESFTPLAVLPFLKSGEGDVAETFERLAEAMAAARGKMIISINDVSEIRSIFGAFEIYETSTTYSISSRTGAKRVGELVIANFEIENASAALRRRAA